MQVNFSDLPLSYFVNERSKAQLQGILESDTPLDKVGIRIGHLGGREPWRNISIKIGSGFSGSLRLAFGRSNGKVTISNGVRFNAEVNMWNNASISIGAGTTCNHARITLDFAQLKIGNDCMISDEVLIQGGDQHRIFDCETSQQLNKDSNEIELGNHVWVGRRVTLLNSFKIGSGSIVALGSIVTRDVPEKSLAAGIPAKVVRSGCSWTRNARPSHAEIAAAMTVTESEV